jgi:caa(3)-type oxidase subunit IV
MSHHHSASEIQHLYEGDQSKLYSGVLQHHADVNSPESKKQVKRIWSIFWVLLVITVAEVMMGMFASHSLPGGVGAVIFLLLTIVKAGFIVAVFMHLGDEFKGFKVTVLLPLILFVWFIIAFLTDGGFWLRMNNSSPARHPVTEQASTNK